MHIKIEIIWREEAQTHHHKPTHFPLGRGHSSSHLCFECHLYLWILATRAVLFQAFVSHREVYIQN